MICEDLAFIKIWRQSNIKQEHIPSSLAECLDPLPSTRREAWRFWLIILLILPTLYYTNDMLIYEKNKFMNRGSKRDAVSRRPLRVVSNTRVKMTVAHIKEMTTGNPLIKLPICFVNKSQLGKFSVRWPKKGTILDNQYPMISKGGYYCPVSCQSRHKVGVLVPYRDREENLSVFLYNIHPFLMKQKLEYRIFIVEQEGTDKFNRGRLFNAGFEEMKKYGSWHCIVFHDVDLIPLDERILYSCPSWPRHMSPTVIQKLNGTKNHSIFGGVTSMTPSQYETVNGYSNLYLWGSEDLDMFWRLRFAGLHMTRYSKAIAEYLLLPHPKPPPNPLRFVMHAAKDWNSLPASVFPPTYDVGVFRRRVNRYVPPHEEPAKYKQEGLSTVEYKLVSVAERPLYTHIVVDINPARKINSNPI